MTMIKKGYFKLQFATQKIRIHRKIFLSTSHAKFIKVILRAKFIND